MVGMELIEHATVAGPADAAAATRAAPGGAERHRMLANEQEVGEYAASTALDEILEEEIRNKEPRDEGVDVDYDTNSEILVDVNIAQMRRYFTELKERHRDPMANGLPSKMVRPGSIEHNPEGVDNGHGTHSTTQKVDSG